MKNHVEQNSFVEWVEWVEWSSSWESQSLQTEITQDLIRSWKGEEVLWSLVTDPETQEVVDKVMNSCIARIESPMMVIDSISSYVWWLVDAHPDLIWMLIFDLKINNLSCDNPEDCTPDEKVLLISLEETLRKKNNMGVDEFRFSFDQNFKKTSEDVTKNFIATQSGLRDPIKSFNTSFGLSENESKKFIKYLKHVEEQSLLNAPAQSWNAVWYLIAIVWTAVVTSLLWHTYNEIRYWNGKPEYKSGPVSLWEPEYLAKLIAASQSFEQTGESYNKQYEVDENDSYYYMKTLANAFQSKELIMKVSWELWVSFDLDQSRFEYNPATKMIEISLSKPTVWILDSDAEVLFKNGEVFESPKFNNDEIKLKKKLENDAIISAEETNDLLLKAQESTMDIFLNVFWPLLESFDKELVWIKVTIDGNERIKIKW